MKYIAYIILFHCYLYTIPIYAQETETIEIDSLKELLLKSEKAQKIDHFISLAKVYDENKNRNLDSAYYYAEQAMGYSEQYKKPVKGIEALYLMGMIKIHMKNYEEAKLHMEEVLSKSKTLSYKVGLRKGNFGMGIVFEGKKEIPKSIPYAERAYALAKENGEEKEVIVDMAVRLSVQYKNIFEYNKASKLLESAIVYIENESIPMETKCLFYTNAALINFELDRIQKALEQFIKALDFAKKSNNTFHQLIASANIGNLYISSFENKDYKKALPYNLFALELVDENPELAGYKGIILNYVAVNYYGLKDYDKSIHYHEKAIKILKDGDPRRYGEALLYLAYAQNEMKQSVLADMNLKDASKQFLKVIENEKRKKEDRSKEEISSSYEYLSEIDSVQGNFKGSLKYHKLYVAYKDSLAKETNIKISERLEFVKQNAEKNAKISQLALENNKQHSQRQSLIIGLIFICIMLIVLFNRFRLKQKAFKIIKEKNRQNTLLMGEIHHRVKNNLQIILSLLNVQISNHHTNKELEVALIESKNKIQSMAIIHQNLYQGNNFTKVQANLYINELLDNLQKSFSNALKFEMDIDPEEIKMGLAIPLGLIVNELITNCFKYAFSNYEKENNIVKISFKQTDLSHKYQLLIQDNGKGLPENFDLHTSPSFGMQLVHGLVEQLHGKIEIIQEKGTAFKICLEEPIAA